MFTGIVTDVASAAKNAIGKIEEAGYEWRVVKRDLEDFPVTMDYRPTRINLTIKEGIVYKVSVG